MPVKYNIVLLNGYYNNIKTRCLFIATRYILN